MFSYTFVCFVCLYPPLVQQSWQFLLTLMTINRFFWFFNVQKTPLQALFTTSFDMKLVNKDVVVDLSFIIAFEFNKTVICK